MGSLYQKALAVREKAQVEAFKPGEAVLSDQITGVSPEDQIEIIAQIDRIVSSNRIQTTTETFKFSSRRSGIFLPVLINLLAIFAVLSGAYLSQFLFRQKEESLVQSSAGFLSSEGKLLEAVRREAEYQFNKKDQEISAIQKRLSSLYGEREQQKALMDERFRQREGELKEELTRKLVEEQQRLRGEGLSSADVDRRVRTLETTLTAQYRNELDRLQEQLQAELAQKQSGIDALIEDQGKTMEQARQERMRLQEQYQDREATVRAQLQERERELESERNRLAIQYDQLREQREKEQLANDYILNTYQRVSDYFTESLFSEALTSLAGLEQYLFQDSVVALPAVQQRRPVELFIIGSLRKLIENERQLERQDTQSLVDSANLLSSFSRIVAEADSRFQAGDISMARELYLSALEKIPAVRSSYQRLREIDRQAEAKTGEHVFEEKIRLLENDLIKAKKELAAQSLELARIKPAIEQSVRKLEQMQRLKQNYVTAETEGELTATRSPQELRDLLQIKLLVKEILDSEPVRSRYPGMYDKLDLYLDAYGAERAVEGRVEAVQDVIAIVEQFSREQEAEALEGVWERYRVAYSRNRLLRLLEALEDLLE
jgi:hypothetical protein